MTKQQKWVYHFSEKNVTRELVGGKGAGLFEMTRIGLPVPPGFTITTDACKAFYKIAKGAFPKRYVGTNPCRFETC